MSKPLDGNAVDTTPWLLRTTNQNRYIMKVKVLEEHGYDVALMGMSYSYMDNNENTDEWWPEQRTKAEKRSLLLAGKGGGHNKFLESIVVWMDIEASRAFWQEFDTYRIGVTKQSTSTMHKLEKRRPTIEDFEEGTPIGSINAFISVWDEKLGLVALKHALPEGYLQRRIVCLNYMSIRNIYAQRLRHRYLLWGCMLKSLVQQLEHPDLITSVVDNPAAN